MTEITADYLSEMEKLSDKRARELKGLECELDETLATERALEELAIEANVMLPVPRASYQTEKLLNEVRQIITGESATIQLVSRLKAKLKE